MSEGAARVGQQLGNYRLLHLLGRGGFAEVYLAQHLRLNTQAAIKVLHTQLADEESDDFQREAQTVAALDHPHIVRVLDFDVKDGIAFLVMDYAPNGSLRRLHPKGSVVPLPIIISYVKQVADALQHAHNQKLIHRDVKPENMLIGRRNDLLLSDFGIATVTQSSRYQSTQEVVGTVAYMAPEQVQGKPRPASDQYSLGIVVYEWLSGTRPFQGSFTEIATQHVLASPPPLRTRVPSISPEVEQVVLTTLAKDPKQRFASVQAFATALEQAGQAVRSPSHELQPPTPSPVLRDGPIQSPSPELQPPALSSAPRDGAITLPASIERAQPVHLERKDASAPESSRGSSPSPAVPRTTAPVPPKRPPRREGFSWSKVAIPMLIVLALLIVGGARFVYIRSNSTPAVTPVTSGTPTYSPSPSSPNALVHDLVTPGRLTVGSDTNNPPQEFLDPHTLQPAGFDIDLITAIAKKMALQVSIMPTAFDALFGDLNAKKFDVVISAVNITSDRQKQFEFVPYFKASEALLVQTGNTKHFQQLADLCGMSVGVQDGSREQMELNNANTQCQKNNKAAMTIIPEPTEEAVIQSLQQGAFDVTYQDTSAADYYMTMAQYAKKFAVAGVISAPPEGIVIRKGDTVMLNAVKKAFDALKQNGTYHQLFGKWHLTSMEELAVVDRSLWYV